MGFFSWECSHCQLSACSYHCGRYRESAPYRLDEVVILYENGDRITGYYDGYGRVDGEGSSYELPLDRSFELYHRHCYTQANRPNYSEPAICADDQGFFLDGRYDEFFEDPED